MPRKLAIAKHAGGFDSVGWTLLGFLLGASLAVFALLHADFRGSSRALIAPAAALPPINAVVRYSPPAVAVPPLAGPPATGPGSPASEPTLPAARSVNALASAGAASAHAAPTAARPPLPQAPRPAPGGGDSQVADDAAAAGMTSRPSHTPELY